MTRFRHKCFFVTWWLIASCAFGIQFSSFRRSLIAFSVSAITRKVVTPNFQTQLSSLAMKMLRSESSRRADDPNCSSAMEKYLLAARTLSCQPASQPLWLIRAMSFKIVHWNITIVSLAFSFNRKLYNISSQRTAQSPVVWKPFRLHHGQNLYRGVSQVRVLCPINMAETKRTSEREKKKLWTEMNLLD